MKTITKGILPVNQDGNWWVGTIVTCEICGGVFELEENDPVNAEYYTKDAGGAIISTKCITPGCTYKGYGGTPGYMIYGEWPNTISQEIKNL
jgi:hypothetical protein